MDTSYAIAELYLREEMKQLLHHTLLWLIAFSILNTSIDITSGFGINDPRSPDGMVSFNEIESIVEFVLNETSDTDQQFPDQSGNDQQSAIKKATNYCFSLPVKKVSLLSPLLISLTTRPVALRDTLLLAKGFTNKVIQPPDLG